MSFIQDSYRIEDPKDATIQSLRKLVASLNVQLGQMANRIALLEGNRPAALDGGGYSITNVQPGMASQTAVATRQDIQQRSLYRANRIAELQSDGRIRASRGVSRSTLGKLPDETTTVAQLNELEMRNGRLLTLPANVAISTTAFADVTGLEFSVAENTSYSVDAHILFTLGATTQGINLTCNGPASPTSMSFIWVAPLSATTVASRAVTAYDTSTTAATSAAGDNIARFRGIFKCGTTPGTWILRAACDAAGSSGTILAGSTLRYALLA